MLFRICPIGEKALKLCAHEEDHLLEILDQGAKDAQKEAEITLRLVKE